MKRYIILIILLTCIMFCGCSRIFIVMLYGKIMEHDKSNQYHIGCVAEDGTQIDRAVKEFNVDSDGKYFLEIASINLYPQKVILYNHNEIQGYILFTGNRDSFWVIDGKGKKYQLEKTIATFGQNKFSAFKGDSIPIYRQEKKKE